MKRLILTILFLFYCGNAFANPHKLIETVLSKEGKAPNNHTKSFLYKGVLNCVTQQKPSKENGHVEVRFCASPSGVGYVKLTNIKTQESQEYAWSNLDLAASKLF